jgi:uncharacterized membrane protein YsdA (DUF1294 family)
MEIVYGCLIALNLLTLYLMAYDKSQARKHGRRIPERTLFLLAGLGGAIGSILGMRIWRHKTKHISFVIGMPVLLAIHIAVVYWIMH